MILKVLLVPVVPVGGRAGTIDDSSKLLLATVFMDAAFYIRIYSFASYASLITL